MSRRRRQTRDETRLPGCHPLEPNNRAGPQAPQPLRHKLAPCPGKQIGGLDLPTRTLEPNTSRCPSHGPLQKHVAGPDFHRWPGLRSSSPTAVRRSSERYLKVETKLGVCLRVPGPIPRACPPLLVDRARRLAHRQWTHEQLAETLGCPCLHRSIQASPGRFRSTCVLLIQQGTPLCLRAFGVSGANKRSATGTPLTKCCLRVVWKYSIPLPLRLKRSRQSKDLHALLLHDFGVLATNGLLISKP